jgi:hypothetical protein
MTEHVLHAVLPTIGNEAAQSLANFARTNEVHG